MKLKEFTTRQLVDLSWEIQGTPEVQPVYRELSSSPTRLTLKPDDPDWEEKLRNSLLAQLEAQP